LRGDGGGMRGCRREREGRCARRGRGEWMYMWARQIRTRELRFGLMLCRSLGLSGVDGGYKLVVPCR
jgi:hypothetical protein